MLITMQKTKSWFPLNKQTDLNQIIYKHHWKELYWFT